MKISALIRRFIVATYLPMLSVLPASALHQPAPPTPQHRPNILLIMSDDHATAAISCYGSRLLQTPHLDRLASQGTRFTQCFATNAICSPSRAAILTGKYGHKNGVMAFDPFDGTQATLPKYLQQAGYHTGLVGKWHLTTEPTGFDTWRILPGQGLYHDPVFISPAAGRQKVKGYATDLVTDYTIDFLKNRPQDKPFFLMSHHKAPHRAWEPNEKYRQLYADKQFPEPATLFDDYTGRSPAFAENQMRIAADFTRADLKLTPPPGLTAEERLAWLKVKPTEVQITENGQTTTLTGQNLARWKYQRYMQDYLACVASLDDNIGRLLQYLDDSGLAENTLVIYTSDQGFFLGEHGLFDKRYMHEPSITMPLIIRWPGTIAPGSVRQAMVTNVDFAPTLLAAAGLPTPPDMQGRSFLPILQGTLPADWPTSFYYRYAIDGGEHNTAAHCGVRTTTHKLIHYYTRDQWELYDLTTDPHEIHNLYGQPAAADITAQLKSELSRLQKLYDDQALASPAGVVPAN
jgi:arylsulfatase A-like enzyme